MKRDQLKDGPSPRIDRVRNQPNFVTRDRAQVGIRHVHERQTVGLKPLASLADGRKTPTGEGFDFVSSLRDNRRQFRAIDIAAKHPRCIIDKVVRPMSHMGSI